MVRKVKVTHRFLRFGLAGLMLLAPVAAAAQEKIAFETNRDGNSEIYVMNPDGTGQINVTNSPSEDFSPAYNRSGTRIAFVSNRDGNFEIYSMNPDGSDQVNLTNDPGSDSHPAFSTDGSKIAFTSSRDGNSEIYIMNSDGTNQVRLTNNDPGSDDDPTFSPDGSRIAFVSVRNSFQDIYIMNIDGSGQTPLTNDLDIDTDPAFSPTGEIGFTSTRNGNFAIYRMDADGSDVTQLTFLNTVDAAPAFNHDGSRIAFGSARDGNFQVYAMNADGTDQTRLANNLFSEGPASWGGQPVDDTKIAFASFRDGNQEIYIMNPDGSGQLRLTTELSPDAEPVISPDGTKVAFRSSRDGNDEIYLMNVDGSNPVNLTLNPGNDFSPAFSPDGSKILFTSNRESSDPGDRDIYVMNVNGSNAVRVADSPTSDAQPQFSPDGSEIVFSRRVDFVSGSVTIFAADVFVMHANGTEQQRLTNATERFFYQTPSFSPDGSRIVLHLFISSFSGPSENRIVVMNSVGGGQTPLTAAGNLDSKPSFSPDGSQIAFVSGRDGDLEIYKMNADGTGPQRLTNVDGIDLSPSWGGQAAASGSAPTVTAATVVRVEGTSAVGAIATAIDADQDEESLTVDVTPLTGSGVTLTSVAINANGEISANVTAGCGATDSTFNVEVTDEVGNTSSAVVTVTVTNETVDPVIDPISNIVVSLPFNTAATSMPVDFPLPTATDNCSTPTVTTDPLSGSNFNIGTTTVNVTATDSRGNEATSSFTVTVRYNFTGFFQPVDNLPALNIASAGSSIPLKFSLSGNKGLNIVAAGYPVSGQIPCDASEPGSTVEETVNAGGSSLSYSATADQYTYVWKTQKAWKNTCRIIVFRLIDGTEHLAKFRFR